MFVYRDVFSSPRYLLSVRRCKMFGHQVAVGTYQSSSQFLFSFGGFGPPAGFAMIICRKEKMSFYSSCMHIVYAELGQASER